MPNASYRIVNPAEDFFPLGREKKPMDKDNYRDEGKYGVMP